MGSARLARVVADGGQGGGGRPGVGRGVLSASFERARDGGARGGGSDRRAADVNALVLPLHRLVSALRAGRDIRRLPRASDEPGRRAVADQDRGGGLSRATAALLLLCAGWAATLWLAPFSDERVNDLFVYREFTAPVLGGALPYRDVFFEYPPLAAPAIALPGLAGTGEDAFELAFAGWTLLLAAAVLLICGSL